MQVWVGADIQLLSGPDNTILAKVEANSNHPTVNGEVKFQLPSSPH